jgi:hypothetical protein
MGATHQTLGDLLELVGGALLALGLLFLMVGGGFAAAVLLVVLLIVLALLAVTGAIDGGPFPPAGRER